MSRQSPSNRFSDDPFNRERPEEPDAAAARAAFQAWCIRGKAADVASATTESAYVAGFKAGLARLEPTPALALTDLESVERVLRGVLRSGLAPASYVLHEAISLVENLKKVKVRR